MTPVASNGTERIETDSHHLGLLSEEKFWLARRLKTARELHQWESEFRNLSVGDDTTCTLFENTSECTVTIDFTIVMGGFALF